MKQLIILTILFFSAELFSQNEPWNRPLKICQSTDGINFTDIETFQDSSGVPHIVRLPSGNLVSVFQWFRKPVGSLSWDRVAVKFSSDSGATWSHPQPVIVNNFPPNFVRPFDPTLAVTNDNRIRMFFSSGIAGMLPDSAINTYSAISDDGVNYFMESGFRFSMPDSPVVGPAVIKFRNLWHLENPIVMGGRGAYHNISTDGFNFTRVQNIASDFTHQWIGNYMIENDTSELRFYGGGMNIWYSSSPNGGSWSGFSNTNIEGGDPCVLKIGNGHYIMVYVGMPYTTGIDRNVNLVNFTLHQNYPNPFNPVTVIKYTLIEKSEVSLSINDITGKEVFSSEKTFRNPGQYTLNFNGINLPAGIYLVHLRANHFQSTKKMILIK